MSSKDGKRKRPLVPRLRFPEFREAGEWENKPLGKMCNVLQGYGFPEVLQGKHEGKYPFYKVSDISRAVVKNGGLLDEATNYVGDDELLELRAKLIPKGATVFAKIGEALRLNRRAYTQNECLIDNNTTGLKAIEGTGNDYFVYLLSQLIDLNKHCGGAVPSVNKTTLEKIAIVVPGTDEQKRIADCLSSLDELISLEAQKLEALKRHKKGLMQQLFPREGETIPRLRFPEFREAGEWEILAMSQICRVTQGGTPSTTVGRYWGGTIPWITPAEMGKDIQPYVSKTARYITCEGLKNCSSELLPENSVIISTRAPIGYLAINTVPMAINQGCRGLIPFKEHNHLFIYYYLCKSRDSLNDLGSGNTFKELSGSVLQSFSLTMPQEVEQQKIADCLSSLDERITLEAQKLEALKRHKKGLMQQLFPVLDDGV